MCPSPGGVSKLPGSDATRIRTHNMSSPQRDFLVSWHCGTLCAKNKKYVCTQCTKSQKWSQSPGGARCQHRWTSRQPRLRVGPGLVESPASMTRIRVTAGYPGTRRRVRRSKHKKSRGHGAWSYSEE
eukprot:1029452-Rhodomonas_salina.1